MQEHPSVSVVIPLLSADQQLAETLESVLGQTRSAAELIIVSAIPGGVLPPGLAHFSDKVKVVGCPHGSSVSLARNLGSAAASGDLIAFGGAASVWEPRKLELQVSYLLANPDVDLVHTGCTALINGTEVYYLDKPPRLTSRDMLDAGHLLVNSVLIRRHVMSDTRGFDPGFTQTEGFEFAFRLVGQGYKLDFLAEPLVYLRTDNTQQVPFDWYVYFVTHAKVVWRNRRYYQQQLGWFGTWQHLMKHLRNAGLKQGGLKGKLLSVVATVLYPFS